MKLIRSLRKAFSLLELVFVIVILGIVSSIGAEIIVQIYESYITERAHYRASIKTELALNQVANRLRYAIPGTVYVRQNIVASANLITEIGTDNDKVLQWVAYDGDSFEAITSSADRKPGWSGFCDVDGYVPGTNSLPTPGSNLDLASEIITNLKGNLGNSVIYFPDETSYGVSGGSAENITLDNNMSSGSRIYERYKLAWTSYALEVDSNNDLILHYNFSPVSGAIIGGSQSILLHDVSNFRFKGSEGSLRIKICKEERIGMDVNDTIYACKEKVIF